MGRLTKKEVSGKWQLNGIPWEKLQKGETITEDVSQCLYGCLCKLKDYEDTGMSPYQMGNWWYELEDMAGHVCDDLCRYRQELPVQEKATGSDRMKAVMKYPGSKWSLAKWIIGFFPEHHSYLEPFFGSGAVLFQKPRSNIETVNDLDDNVVNLFDWIRRDPEKLAHEIYWTPYARKVYEDAFSLVPEDSLGKAVNFYIRLNMGHGFRTNGEKVGWKNDVQGRERAYAVLDWCRLPEKILRAAERLQGVQIENRPAVEVIEKFNFPNVLVYADPPYVLNTRHGKQYRCEMDDIDHNDLLDVLLAHRGPVLLSGYDNDLYDDRLQGWYREDKMNYAQSCSKRREVLWMNFKPDKQMSLFDCK